MSHDSVGSTKIDATGGNSFRDCRSSFRIGLLGGTFDPPHLGHLVLADQVRFERNLDEVWFVVANDPWQKTDVRQVTPVATRLALVAAALTDRPGLVASDVEIQIGGVSSTAGTLRHLGDRHPGVEFEVIVGSDAIAGLGTWLESEWLAEHANFVAVNRGGQPGEAPPGFTVSVVDMPLLEISSTDLRRRFSCGEPVRFLVPDAVCELVGASGLYSSESW